MRIIQLSLAALFFYIFTASALHYQGYSQTNKDYEQQSDIFYRDASVEPVTDYMKERCVLDIYYPKNKQGFPTVVWFHGGGLKAGNKFIPQWLKNKDIAVVAVNYRFSPEVSCPAYIQDAAAAVAWVFRNIEAYGGDPGLIIVSGHSAGGYLTSMIGLDKRYLEVYGIDANQIASLVPFSGHTITHFTIREERGIAGTQPIIDEFAPLYHLRDDAPPLILITGDRELEMLGRYEENAYMMRMMKVVGHQETTLYELDGFDHGGMAVPAYPLLIREVRRLIKEKASDTE
jgi:acetyl esterase/lipase